MPKLIAALLIGIAAGIIDIIPMIIQKLNKYAIWSAFAHWVVLGFIISYIELPVSPWLKGLIVGAISSIPILILVSEEDKKAIPPILIMSIILGAAVGIASAKFAV